VSRINEVSVGGRRLKLSNLDKIFYPDVGFAKGEVIDYYTRIAPVLLPHLNDRPLTMKRYPDGVDGKFFYEKQKPSHAPAWVKSIKVQGRRPVDYILGNDLATLVWLANLADLELHTSLSKKKPLQRPTAIAFDLDPGPPAAMLESAQVALLLRDLLADLDLEAWPKTSGSKGIQIYVPINGAVTYDDTKPFAHAVAKILEKQHPDLVVSKMLKKLRTGKVLIDWSQNDEHKTTVSVYSLRARERPTVSTPLEWGELEQVVEDADASALDFVSDDVLGRVDRSGDLFAPVLERKQKLPKLA